MQGPRRSSVHRSEITFCVYNSLKENRERLIMISVVRRGNAIGWRCYVYVRAVNCTYAIGQPLLRLEFGCDPGQSSPNWSCNEVPKILAYGRAHLAKDPMYCRFS